MMNELTNFVYLSKYAGQRFDLVQAGGGNVSTKLDNGIMLIKASGVHLSEVEHDNGYVQLKIAELKNILSDKNLNDFETKKEKDFYASTKVCQAIVAGSGRPSLETLAHAMLGKYVLHVHPIMVNAALSHPDFVKSLKSLSYRNYFIEYKTPGIELALELKKVCAQGCVDDVQLFFLKNHGLIVSGSSAYEIIEATEDVLAICERHLDTSLADYRLCNIVSDLINNVVNGTKIAYPICDMDVNNTLLEVMSMEPFSPDQVVYCGVQPLILDSLEDEIGVKQYVKKFGMAPKIVVYQQHVFCIAQNVKKAREVEDVLRAGILTHALSDNMMDSLSAGELEYLSCWDAEKYRQEL